jgi:hypothetical protein
MKSTLNYQSCQFVTSNSQSAISSFLNNYQIQKEYITSQQLLESFELLVTSQPLYSTDSTFYWNEARDYLYEIILETSDEESDPVIWDMFWNKLPSQSEEDNYFTTDFSKAESFYQYA